MQLELKQSGNKLKACCRAPETGHLPQNELFALAHG